MIVDLPTDFKEIIKEDGRSMYTTHLYLVGSSYDAILAKMTANSMTKEKEVKIHNLKEECWTFNVILIESCYRDIPANLPTILDREASAFSNFCFASFYMFDGCFNMNMLDDDWSICQIYGISTRKSLPIFAFSSEERTSDNWHQEVRKMAVSISKRFPELKSAS